MMASGGVRGKRRIGNEKASLAGAMSKKENSINSNRGAAASGRHQAIGGGGERMTRHGASYNVYRGRHMAKNSEKMALSKNIQAAACGVAYQCGMASHRRHRMKRRQNGGASGIMAAYVASRVLLASPVSIVAAAYQHLLITASPLKASMA